jgi:predicted RNA-binding protein with PUA-like domain
LVSRPDQTECWDGVRNYQARNMMRDQMRVGDQGFFYHSNCKEPGIVGLVEIVSSAYPDHTQFDPEADHYDPTSSVDNPRWIMVDVKFLKKFDRVLTLNELRENPLFSSLMILRKGNRLSITPVSSDECQAICRWVDAEYAQ